MTQFNSTYFISKIKEISEIGLTILLPETKEQLRELEFKSLSKIESQTYIKIPIVGLFNAGKTSLINAVVGQNGLLPVDLIPTTAIPCEIYASEAISKQHAQIIRAGEQIYDGSFEGYAKFETKPGDIGRAYIFSDFIRECSSQGIVLVDMPGSDSGIREHNEAILRYVEEGSAFALIVSAKGGSLSSTELAFVKEVQEYGIPCSLFLSKTDLVDKESLDEIKEFCCEQFYAYTSRDSFVGTICAAKGKVNAFCEWVKSIDINEVNKRKFEPIVSTYLEAVRNAIIDYREIISADFNLGDIDSKIKQLEKQLKKLNDDLNDALRSADTPEKSTQDILDYVDKAIRANARLVAESIMSGNITQINDTIMSVIRPALLKALAEEREQFITTMKAELDVVTKRILDNIDIPSDVIDDLISENSDSIIGYLQLIANRLMESGNQWAVLAGQALRILAEYVPDFVRKILGGQERALKKIEQKFVGQFSQQILSSLKSIVHAQVKTQQEHILAGIRQHYEQKVMQIKEALKHLKETRDNDKNDFLGNIAILDEALNKLSNLYGGLA